MTSQRGSLPLTDAGALARAARRTALVRGALVAAILAVVSFTCAISAGGSALAAGGGRTGTVVVLDVSGSIGESSARAIRRALAAEIRGSGRDGGLGLVLFSDTAFEALPPTAPPAALADYRHFFVPHSRRRFAGRAGVHSGSALGSSYPANPWQIPFSDGTNISTGLRAAREALRRAGDTGGRVLLLSDLDDSQADLGAVRREIETFARNPRLHLQVRALPGYQRSQFALYRRVLGDRAVGTSRVAPAASLRPAGGHALPPGLLVAAALAAGALAAWELLGVPMRWRTPKAAA